MLHCVPAIGLFDVAQHRTLQTIEVSSFLAVCHEWKVFSTAFASTSCSSLRSTTSSTRVMVARVLLLVVLFVSGAEAIPFANGTYLKIAVDNCIAYNNTGVACCGPTYDSGCGDPSTARCGVAGCEEMPSWDVSLVTNMGSMFYYASAFIADISGWNTSSVTDMTFMFYGASAFNADISGWDTSSVTGSTDMFWDASAWTASYARHDCGGSSADGPPSCWYRVSPWPPPPPSAPSPPSASNATNVTTPSASNTTTTTAITTFTAIITTIIHVIGLA